MKLTSNLLSLGLLAAPASAFPADIMERAIEHPELLERFTNAMASVSKRDLITADGATAVYEAIPVFNAKAQYIDVGPGSGHEWQAPGPNDLRGPCPGLNAFANHGFLPRNGYATITQFLDATENVVGMGVDLAAFLAVFGAVIDGSGLAWSIGGTPPASIAGLLGGGNGISGSHNKYVSSQGNFGCGYWKLTTGDADMSRMPPPQDRISTRRATTTRRRSTSSNSSSTCPPATQSRWTR